MQNCRQLLLATAPLLTATWSVGTTAQGRHVTRQRRSLMPTMEMDSDQHPVSRTVFCNRALNMDKLQCVGLDLDYTLAEYTRDFDQLAYDGSIRKLLAMGYPEEVGDFVYQPSRYQRGLLIDKKRGNMLKLDRHKYVKVAYHGLTKMASEERKARAAHAQASTHPHTHTHTPTRARVAGPSAAGNLRAGVRDAADVHAARLRLRRHRIPHRGRLPLLPGATRPDPAPSPPSPHPHPLTPIPSPTPRPPPPHPQPPHPPLPHPHPLTPTPSPSHPHPIPLPSPSMSTARRPEGSHARGAPPLLR
jgi:hypothetical protein